MSTIRVSYYIRKRCLVIFEFIQSVSSFTPHFLFICLFNAISLLYLSCVSRSPDCHSLSLQPQFAPLLVFDHKIFLKCSLISFTLRSLFLTPDSLNLSSKNIYKSPPPRRRAHRVKSKCCATYSMSLNFRCQISFNHIA